jgi:diguanylate cyclase (GGDEF)-like protein
VRELGASFAGPLLVFGLLVGRLLLPAGTDRGVLAPSLFGAVVVGAVFGGRWSALGTAGLAALGLALAWDEFGALATAANIAIAFAIALTTGELRDRAERGARQVEIANTRLKRLALRDALTGLLDRRGFEFALRVELARETRRRGRFALLVLGLTGLKAANDRFGRSVGDTALQVFADAIDQRVRDSDIAARLGDDEFAVILPDTDDRGADLVARDVIARFLAEVRGIFPEDLAVSGRFGIARFPEDGRGPDELLAAAAEHPARPFSDSS